MSSPNKHTLFGVMLVSIHPRHDALQHYSKRGESLWLRKPLSTRIILGKFLPMDIWRYRQPSLNTWAYKDGDEVAVALHKVTSTAPGISLPEEAQTLIQELIGAPSTTLLDPE
jgi:hypothetical protein